MSELALVDQGLSEIPLHLAESRGPVTKALNLTENHFVPPGNLQHFRVVETLILDKNDLENLEGFPRMESVTTLWFNNNKLSDIVDFMDQITALFPNLAYLSAMRNPASAPLVLMSEEDVAFSRRYRLYVAYRLPKLQFLDSAPVTPAERVEAAATGQFMAVRKPKRAVSTGSTGGVVGPAASSPTSTGGSDVFFGGAVLSSGSGASAGPGSSGGGGAESGDDKKSTAFLGLGTTHYDGRHSEGNRFIVDRHL